MELLTIDHPIFKENKDKIALELLKKAKKRYINSTPKYGMCHALYDELYILFSTDEYEFNEEFIDILIPEFNREYLNTQYSHWSEYAYYWDITNEQARIEAFDKLIDLYTNKLNNHETIE